MARHVICAARELAPGERRIVEVEGRSIGVFNVAGAFLAVRNRCPHQGGPLCEGVLVGALTSDAPGEYHHERPGEVIRCPWHGWEFDLRTGASWFDPTRRRVRAYEVGRMPGADLANDRGAAADMIRGPYTAETLPIRVEDDYLVINL